MKKIILISLFLGTTNLFAQQQDSILVKEISFINKDVLQQRQDFEALTKKLNSHEHLSNQQKERLDTLFTKFQNQERIIDSLKASSQVIKSNIDNIAYDLGIRIQQTGESVNSKILELDSSLESNRLSWIIATLVTLILGGVVYWLLGKRISISRADVESQIERAKKSLEEEGLKLDSKLVEVLETKLKLKQEEKQIAQVSLSNNIDHSLALKVADEIVRMQKNISRMDSSTKGLKPLEKGIERIQANFASNGYEMINLLNKDYDERMNIDVINFSTDENLAEGRKVITAVVKPQVNYNGVLIQRAQVDVSQN